MPWHTASGRTVPWRSVSELSRLRLKRPERLVRPDAKDANFFFPDERHSTHNKPIPPLEGQSDFGDKCKASWNAVFPPVNTAPRTPLPPDLLTHTRDIRNHTRPVTIHETRLAIAHLKYGISVGPDGISYTTLRHFNEVAPLLLSNLFTACLT